jgi:eukaryotic-like serine/threonine-protein kinase
MPVISSACAHKNIDGDRFCDVCGSGLPIICLECGHTNSASNEFCDVCGTPFESIKTIQLYDTRNINLLNDAHCPICFSYNPHEESVCASCGNSLTKENTIVNSKVSHIYHLQPNIFLKQGKYKVNKSLRESNFNIVYEAFDMSTLNKVAIKELLPDQSSRRGTAFVWPPSVTIKEKRTIIEEFLFAAKEWSECLHPKLVKVLDWFEENETAYVVMEFIDGETLASILEREKKLSESRVKLYLLQISNALSVVHAKGILHRDINPSSIMLNQYGRPIVIDFDNSRQFTGKEQKMSIFGTTDYTPIEQNLSVGEFTPSVDIYSLCVSAYEMLTGELPVKALDRVMERIKSISDSLILPSKLISLSSSMEAILLKGLGIIPNERFQSMQELIDALLEMEE